MKTAEVIRVSGERSIVAPNNGSDFTLAELRGMVGGVFTKEEAEKITIEVLYCKDGKILVVDEEGRLKGLPVNPAATEAFGFGINILGDAVLCEKDLLK